MTSLFSSVSMALQSMLAHQASIQVIEHNVANANTPGYHRQEAMLATGPSTSFNNRFFYSKFGSMGNGVVLDHIRRFNLEFFDGRLRRETAESRYWDQQRTTLLQVEGTLAETTQDGLAYKLDAFWSGWQSLSTDPSNQGLRADLYTKASDLASAFNRKASALMQIRADQNMQVNGLVTEINDLAGRVAHLNSQISGALGVGQQPNDALDERDRMLDRLSELTGATVAIDQSGAALVSINGHALVVADRSFNLVATANPSNNNLLEVAWEDGMTYTGSAGELPGLLTARDSVVPDQLTRLNSMASTLAAQVNAVHSTGYSLNNATGLNFFTGTDALSLRVDALMSDPTNIATAAVPDAPGDGSIAGQILSIQNNLLFAGGTQTFSQYQQQMVAQLGLSIRNATTQSNNRQLVVDTLNAQRESAVGVNLDEEAANLIKSQKAYQAATRLVNVVDEMMDRIINGMGLVGR